MELEESLHLEIVSLGLQGVHEVSMLGRGLKMR